MENLERALQITGSGIGLVFLSLVALTLITMLLSRLFRPKPLAPPGGEATPAPDPAGARTTVHTVAAIAAALTRAIPPTAPEERAPRPVAGDPGASAWRTQGRQTLMHSQTASRGRWRSTS